jgi:hypothetical protein
VFFLQFHPINIILLCFWGIFQRDLRGAINFRLMIVKLHASRSPALMTVCFVCVFFSSLQHRCKGCFGEARDYRLQALVSSVQHAALQKIKVLCSCACHFVDSSVFWGSSCMRFSDLSYDQIAVQMKNWRKSSKVVRRILHPTS